MLCNSFTNLYHRCVFVVTIENRLLGIDNVCSPFYAHPKSKCDKEQRNQMDIAACDEDQRAQRQGEQRKDAVDDEQKRRV